MSKADHPAQGELLPLIPHEIEGTVINQRAADGYVNATAMCKLSGKLFADYARLKSTSEFVTELSSDMGIPISELIQTLKGGDPAMQGTWVHPPIHPSRRLGCRRLATQRVGLATLYTRTAFSGPEDAELKMMFSFLNSFPSLSSNKPCWSCTSVTLAWVKVLSPRLR